MILECGSWLPLFTLASLLAALMQETFGPIVECQVQKLWLFPKSLSILKLNPLTSSKNLFTTTSRVS